MRHLFANLSADRLIKLAVIACLASTLVGCAGGFPGMGGPVQSQPTAYVPSQPPVLPAASASNMQNRAEGSLYRDDAPLVAMVSDQKARTVGDIVTIKIAESSDATNKAAAPSLTPAALPAVTLARSDLNRVGRAASLSNVV